MKTLNNREDQGFIQMYLDTSLNLIELFVDKIIEIHHLPNFEAYFIYEKADIHSVAFVKSTQDFNKIYDVLSNVYTNIELLINEPTQVLIKFVENNVSFEILLVEYSDASIATFNIRNRTTE